MASRQTETHSILLVIVFALIVIVSITIIVIHSATSKKNFTYNASAAINCAYPGQIASVPLTNWKLTLPIGTPSSPIEVKQPELANYNNNSWFMVNSTCNGIQFRAHTSGVTTSGSPHPRSELREMKNNGKDKAKWSTTSGKHTMIIDEAITHLPDGVKKIVVGQIHDGSDDVIVVRLDDKKLYIKIGDTTIGPTLDSAYTLGKRFKVKFFASGGEISIYYNDSSKPSYTMSKSISTAFFKAGAYTQSNCAKELAVGYTCGTNNYGETNIYSLTVLHE